MTNQDLDVALIKLFHGLPIADNTIPVPGSYISNVKRTMKKGYIIDPRIGLNDNRLLITDKYVGIDGSKMNQTFHKSWDVVKNTQMSVLIAQQIVHYITTYGFESIGRFDSSLVYIPAEILEIPDLNVSEIQLAYVKGMTTDEIRAEIIKLGQLALSDETIFDMMIIIRLLKFDKSIVKSIKNRELLIKLYDLFGIAPTEPVEYLRYLIFKLTGETLIIKNRFLIDKIKASNQKELDALLLRAPKNLSSIFLRYKPLFLAMKKVSRNKTFFNKLRKDATRTHVPLKPDVLNNVTASIKQRKFNGEKLIDALEGANIFRKIRLLYALIYREGAFNKSPVNGIKYVVRNGKGYATHFTFSGRKQDLNLAKDIVIDSIVESIVPNVNGKIFYVPQGVHYALPASEKQFIGNVPYGTYIDVESDAIVGVHWVNQNKNRIDLDFSCINNNGKLGWNGSYRNTDGTVLFSGDMTDAPSPKGATESFYFGQCSNFDGVLQLNYFNQYGSDIVEYELFIASQKLERMSKNHTVNPNYHIASFPMRIDKKTTSIGLVKTNGKSCRVILGSTTGGKEISSSWKPYSQHEADYYQNKMNNTILLENLIHMAGGVVVTKIPNNEDFVDLSPRSLTKTSFLDILLPKS